MPHKRRKESPKTFTQSTYNHLFLHWIAAMLKKAVRILHLPNAISQTAVTERTSAVPKLLTIPIYLFIKQAPDGKVSSFNPIRPDVPILRLNSHIVFGALRLLGSRRDRRARLCDKTRDSGMTRHRNCPATCCAAPPHTGLEYQYSVTITLPGGTVV